MIKLHMITTSAKFNLQKQANNSYHDKNTIYNGKDVYTQYMGYQRVCSSIEKIELTKNEYQKALIDKEAGWIVN